MRRIAFAFAACIACFCAQAVDAPKKIYAQELIDQVVPTHPEVAGIEVHVTPPKAADNIVIAAYNGRLGEKADPEDLDELAQHGVDQGRAGDEDRSPERDRVGERPGDGSDAARLRRLGYHVREIQLALRVVGGELANVVSGEVGHFDGGLGKYGSGRVHNRAVDGSQVGALRVES